MQHEHKVVSQEVYVHARQQLLAAERQLTKQRDALAKQRRSLPGYSEFYRDDSGEVFYTYSTFGRGIELLNPVY